MFWYLCSCWICGNKNLSSLYTLGKTFRYKLQKSAFIRGFSSCCFYITWISVNSTLSWLWTLGKTFGYKLQKMFWFVILVCTFHKFTLKANLNSPIQIHSHFLHLVGQIKHYFAILVPWLWHSWYNSHFQHQRSAVRILSTAIFI